MNQFKSIVVRAIETLYAYEEAIRIIENYQMPEKPFIDVDPGKGPGVGHGCTEAPRGALYHRYEIDKKGKIDYLIPGDCNDIIHVDYVPMKRQRQCPGHDWLVWPVISGQNWKACRQARSWKALRKSRCA